MKSVLLIGLGRFGRHVARKLNDMNHQVLAVDKNEKRVEEALPYLTSAQIGDSTEEAFIRSLGVRNFDVCIVAIGDAFQSSLETTCLLKELGARKVVARAARDVHAKFLLRNGADHVVYPEKQLAAWTAIRYTSDHIFDYVELTPDYSIYETETPKEWVGKTIHQLDIRRKYNVTILAVKKGEQINPEIHSDYCFKEEETLLVLGKNKNVQKCFHI